MKTRSVRRHLPVLLCLLSVLMLIAGGCGQRGDLYLPPEPAEKSEPE